MRRPAVSTKRSRIPMSSCARTLSVERLLMASGRQAGRRRGSYRLPGSARRYPPRSSSLPRARSIPPLCFCAPREGGVANRSDAVGRHFMNHNCSAVLAIDPRTVNDSVYQKTLGINDFYLDDGRGGPPLGNIQLLGRVTAPILKSSLSRAPEWALIS